MSSRSWKACHFSWFQDEYLVTYDVRVYCFMFVETNTNPSAYAPDFWSTLPPTHPEQTIWSTCYVVHLFRFLAWPKIWRHTFKMRNEVFFSELRWSEGASCLPVIFFLERCRRDSWTVVLLWACWRGESGCLSSSLCQTFEGIWPSPCNFCTISAPNASQCIRMHQRAYPLLSKWPVEILLRCTPKLKAPCARSSPSTGLLGACQVPGAKTMISKYFNIFQPFFLLSTQSYLSFENAILSSYLESFGINIKSHTDGLRRGQSARFLESECFCPTLFGSTSWSGKKRLTSLHLDVSKDSREELNEHRYHWQITNEFGIDIVVSLSRACH